MPNNQKLPSEVYSGHNIYDEKFYRRNKKTEYAASIIIEKIKKIFSIYSVTDVGCGRGAWLVACKNNGITDLHGLDGSWNSQDQMLDQIIKFSPVDLSGTWRANHKSDLCISLEVAEHINPKSSQSFVDELCSISDLIIFGAAYEEQGGVGHINERRHSFWANYFLQNNYDAYDLIRPICWHDASIDFWYRQNTFLYIKRNSVPFITAQKYGLVPIANIAFMDAIHPDLYKIKCEQTLSLGQILKRIGPALVASLKHRLNLN